MYFQKCNLRLRIGPFEKYKSNEKSNGLEPLQGVGEPNLAEEEKLNNDKNEGEIPKTIFQQTPTFDGSIYYRKKWRKFAKPSILSYSASDEDSNHSEDKESIDSEVDKELSEMRDSVYEMLFEEDWDKATERYSPDKGNRQKDFMALLAYEDPEKSPMFHLLSMEYRQDVADSLNRAILAYMKLPSFTAMERLLKQATVVRQCLSHELGKDGVPPFSLKNFLKS